MTLARNSYFGESIAKKGTYIIKASVKPTSRVLTADNLLF
jgi:hypothetical protein